VAFPVFLTKSLVEVIPQTVCFSTFSGPTLTWGVFLTWSFFTSWKASEFWRSCQASLLLSKTDWLQCCKRQRCLPWTCNKNLSYFQSGSGYLGAI